MDQGGLCFYFEPIKGRAYDQKANNDAINIPYGDFFLSAISSLKG